MEMAREEIEKLQSQDDAEKKDLALAKQLQCEDVDDAIFAISGGEENADEQEEEQHEKEQQEEDQQEEDQREEDQMEEAPFAAVFAYEAEDHQDGDEHLQTPPFLPPRPGVPACPVMLRMGSGRPPETGNTPRHRGLSEFARSS